jgi:hypothetical protein
MISESLQTICHTLDQSLSDRFNLSESKIVLNNLIGQDGITLSINTNKIIISIISIQTDNAGINRQDNAEPLQSHNVQSGNHLKFNLHILISANLDDYNESLTFLEEITLFFDRNPVLIVPGTENTKLIVTIEKVSNEQLFNLWNALGAKLIPHLIYHIREN